MKSIVVKVSWNEKLFGQFALCDIVIALKRAYARYEQGKMTVAYYKPRKRVCRCTHGDKLAIMSAVWDGKYCPYCGGVIKKAKS